MGTPLPLCSLPGCRRPRQKAAGSGYSPRYCKPHVEFHRRHGSHWFRSFTAADLKPYRKAARAWLRDHHDDLRVRMAMDAVASLLANAGRVETAYDLRGRPAGERARIALARLREAEIDPSTILERAIAVVACCEARGIDDRQREYRRVQIAKSLHRLASGTHKTRSGLFRMPSKYPRSEGQVLRHLGLWIDDIVSLALDGRDIMEERSIE